jgi:hypothetical protein
MPFYRVLMRVGCPGEADVLGIGEGTHLYKKAFARAPKDAEAIAMRKAVSDRNLHALGAGDRALTFQVVRVTQISLWDWLTCNYSGLLTHWTNAEPCAAPNGGPATPLHNSGVTEGLNRSAR